MNRKIELAKKKKEILARQQELTAKEIKARQSLLDATKKLYDLINGQEQYDFTKLEKQLEKIDKSLDLSKYFTNLERSIKDNSPHAQVTKTKIQDFSKLLEAIAKNKPIPFSIDLTRLEKAVVNIEQYIQNNSGPSDQGAENYQPVRRVLKVGNRFIFDDNFTNAGGGGGSGGGDTNGLTDTELRASAVPVSVSGVATSAKQDTGNTSLASLDTKLPAQGQALAAASTPVVLPAAQITTLTPPAAITGYATASNQTDKSQFTKITDGTDTALVTASGEQNVLETNSAAIKTAVETIDNAVSGAGFNITQFAGTNNAVGSGTATGALRVELPTNGTGTVGLNAGTNAIGKLSANSGVDIGDVDVTSSVSATLDHGSNLDIDTTAEQITTTSFSAKFGVTVKAAVDNTDTVYIGNSDVTAGTTAATDGFPLEPGESITLPVNNSNLLYAIGAAANQKVFWSAV